MALCCRAAPILPGRRRRRYGWCPPGEGGVPTATYHWAPADWPAAPQAHALPSARIHDHAHVRNDLRPARAPLSQVLAIHTACLAVRCTRPHQPLPRNRAADMPPPLT